MGVGGLFELKNVLSLSTFPSSYSAVVWQPCDHEMVERSLAQRGICFLDGIQGQILLIIIFIIVIIIIVSWMEYKVSSDHQRRQACIRDLIIAISVFIIVPLLSSFHNLVMIIRVWRRPSQSGRWRSSFG